MIAGVVIDDWKLPIFKRHLDAAGYKYTEHPGITPDSAQLVARAITASTVSASQK